MSGQSFADQLLEAAVIDLNGSTDGGSTMGRPYMDTDRPTAEEAAELHRELLGAPTVARLDMLLDALRMAYRRGQAAERRDTEQLATDAAARFASEAQELAARHAQEFSAAHTVRARQLAEHDALPWFQQ